MPNSGAGANEQVKERYMPSIFSECDKLKQVYDKCFTDFFQHFISSDCPAGSNPCDRLHVAYRQCVETHIEKSQLFDIDLSEVRKDILNTENDLLRDTQSD